MRNSLIYIVLFFTYFACNERHSARDIINRKSPTSFVTISLDSTNLLPNQRIAFLYLDSLANGHSVALTDKETRILLYTSTMFVASDKNQIPYLIYPGEKIKTRYAFTDTLQLYITGNEIRTNELDFFRKLVLETESIFNVFNTNSYLKSVRTIDEFNLIEEKITALKNKRLAYLDIYKVKYPISNEFFKIANQTIIGSAIDDYILLCIKNRQFLKHKDLLQNVISTKLINLKELTFMPYQGCFRPYLSMIYLATGKNTAIMATQEELKDSFDFIANTFEGTVKDFLMANMLNTAKHNGIKISPAYIEKFKKLCKDIGYKTIIDKKLKAIYTIAEVQGTNNLLSVDGKSVKKMHFILSKYKGKIILLDFWASWCIPCRTEMPYTRQIIKEYKGKDIVFINISTDKDIDRWLKANKEEDLDDEHSFLLLNASQAPFTKRYEINSIPRYILIDREGKVVNEDAPRPSDKELLNKINNLLSN